ncbi:hypothetical protein BGX24_012033 [Mortierella sp. AD032]|nr:hypothetical protein BGX24_012033 [Mortierella sp. AD032]
MRFTLRILVALVLTGVHIQDAIGQPPIKSPPSSTASLRAPSPSALPTTTPFFPLQTPPSDGPVTENPVAVGAMAYASDGKSLFIQGGVHNDSNNGNNGNIVNSTQFFSLDLTQSWKADKPLWKSLKSLPVTVTAPAGGLTTDLRFLVMGSGDQGRIVAYTFNTLSETWDDTGKAWSFSNAVGSVIASSPVKVFILDMDNVTHTFNAQFDESPEPRLVLPSLSALSWSTFNSSLLMTFSEEGAQKLTVGMHNPDSTGTKLITISGQQGPQVPSARTGHCFVPNVDGSTYYVFGGRAGSSFLNDIYSFDVKSATWTNLAKSTPTPAPSRWQMACAVKGKTLVIWGGFTDGNRNSNGAVLLYDIDGQRWIDNFVAPSDDGNTGSQPVGPNPAGGPKEKDGSNLAPIIGGVVGGLAVIALVAGFLIFRRRKARNMKPALQVLPRGGLTSSNGKNPGGHVNVPMDEYTTIPSPFASDDTTPPLYAPPPHQPISASLMNQKPGSIISQQMPYSAAFQAPSIPVRPVTGSPTAPKIQSPFEVETESSACHPLLPVSAGAPISGSLGGFVPGSYHSHGHVQGDSDGRTGGAFSPSMEAATTVDLIPIEASEADNEPEQEQVVVTSRSLASVPLRAKSRNQGPGGKTVLEDDADGRRDSSDTEKLDYLEIS